MPPVVDERAQADGEWQTIEKVVCRVMMMYGYPPCLLCTLSEYCTMCLGYSDTAGKVEGVPE